MLRDTLRWTVGLLAAFGIVNAVLGLASPSLDANIWWIDLRWLPRVLAASLVLLLALPILVSILTPRQARFRLTGTLAAAVLSLLAVSDAVRFYVLLDQGRIVTDLPIPMSLLLALVLALGAWAIAKPPSPTSPIRRGLALIPALALAAAFPLLQMTFFGVTDYRRPADAILVFGARTYVDGSPSDALKDRVRTAAELYHAGLAPRLIMSGGPGDGATHETQAMRTLAISLGVPADCISLDGNGINTERSLVNTAALSPGTVLAVSHFYHLPRIKLEADRAGLAVYTVPAPQGRPLRSLPWFMARETAAWWWYYARPILG